MDRTPASVSWVMGAAGVTVALLTVLITVSIAALSSRYRREFDRRVGLQLGHAHLFIDTRRVMAASVAMSATAALAGGWVSGSAVTAFVLALATGLAPRLALEWLRRRRTDRFRQQLPDVMLLTAGALQAGASLPQALARVAAELQAPARQELDLVMREQRLGALFDDALIGLQRRMPVAELSLMIAACRISHHTGGNLAETLERLAASVRARIALEGKIRALTAQGRLQARVMSMLPALLAFVLFQMDPQAMRPLLEHALGWGVVAFVLVMQALGSWSIRRIVAIDV